MRQIIVIISFVLLFSNAYADKHVESNVNRLINFLVADSAQVGVAYQASAGSLNGLILPLSYYSSPSYWGNYVCQVNGNNCNVEDVYDSNDYTLTPSKNSPGALLQAERVDVFNGADIYDAASWQIALAVAAANGVTVAGKPSLFDIANNQNILLKTGYDGDATNSYNYWDNRAYTDPDNPSVFNYHGIQISQSQAETAYFYRMITKSWLSDDPFINDPTYLSKYIQVEGTLPSNYKIGNVTWMDWKPITGENAWAFFIGPMQSSYLNYVVSKKQAFVPYNAVSVQNAINVLTAFRAMQSPIGAVFYAVPGSLGNVGSQPVNPYSVSVENNASTLAGLLMLSKVLNQQITSEAGLTVAQKARIVEAINNIYTMIYGGKMPNGSNFVYTDGMLNFFKDYAWQQGEFIQGGLANEPNKAVWQPTLEPKAVDVNTWGLAVLGQPLIDSWFGSGSAYQAWQKVKAWGGFTGPDGKLWGVGYSDQYTDPNSGSTCEPGQYSASNAVISAEWTAGAINMANVLSAQYLRSGGSQYADSLKADSQTMSAGFNTLNTDNYSNDSKTQNAYKYVRPANYTSLINIPTDKLAYVYASRRCMIPFGWMANPLPSTTSTSWAVMLSYGFNPFTLGGGDLPNDLYYGALSQPVNVTVTNDVQNAPEIAINYQLANNKNLYYGPHISTSQAFTFPQNTSFIQIDYSKDGKTWYPACRMSNPEKLMAYVKTFGNNAAKITISGYWTNNSGTGECQVVGKL